jgi:hypothetical protein
MKKFVFYDHAALTLQYYARIHAILSGHCGILLNYLENLGNDKTKLLLSGHLAPQITQIFSSKYCYYV